MKINNVAPQFYTSQIASIASKNITTKQSVAPAFGQTPNVTSPIKRDALSHLAYLGIQNLPYRANVTFKGAPNKQKKGYVQVYTGDGKGKTTAAMDLSLRALGQGKKVNITMFTKGGDNYGEIKAFNKLQPDIRKNLTINQAGLDRIVYTSNETEEDRRIMKQGWENAKKVINSGETDLVVLDEINIAVDLNIIDEKDVLETIKNKPENVEIVMTGRNAHKSIIEAADLVSNIQAVKHYYNAGIMAREGIEY